MNYNLAKELYDAGFPQGGKGTWVLPPDQLLARRTDRVYVPTLSELIEACGNGFAKLSRLGAEFCASDTLDRVTSLSITPEEAVARLWLALNTKV